MSAILSADDLNDFIAPGVACIKPVETLPLQRPDDKPDNPYEVTTEDKVPVNNAPPAQISLTDCLACSGCVTSAEAVLIGLQSHEEVLNTLSQHKSLDVQQVTQGQDGNIFIASVSPQTRATLAATYGVSEQRAGYMIQQLLSGPQGLAKSAKGFEWVLDTNVMRETCLEATVQEVKDVVESAASSSPKRPVLASSCPGWICYAEKTHPHILPHLSRLKSPQALMGTMVKSVLSRKFGISPDRIWHLAIMPCFDKKLEASREELTDSYWRPEQTEKRGIRDVDCVITAREVLMLADSIGVRFGDLPQQPITSNATFPDETLNSFLFPTTKRRTSSDATDAGTSGGYAYRLILEAQANSPGSTISIERGRNTDVVDYLLVRDGQVLLKTGRYYGFRNITNLVRKLKPAKQSRLLAARKTPQATSAAASPLSDYAYIEVMACPGGCTNGGGQIKVDDVAGIRGLPGEPDKKMGPAEQKQWQGLVDEAYFSAESSEDESDNTPSQRSTEDHLERRQRTLDVIAHWSNITKLDAHQLLLTSYREVESDVGKKSKSKASDMERVAGLASSIGGGW